MHYHASCLCQTVQFSIEGELSNSRYCYCCNCTKFSGSSPATWAMTHMSAIKVSCGQTHISAFNSGNGLRHFCQSCGSPLWFQSLIERNMVAIPLGVIDNSECIAKPEMSIFTASKTNWCLMDDSLTGFDQAPTG